ncbi:MAG TPA: carbon-nitrogen hydrolase family protein [Chloroflexia bacterium]|jgi:predicted amidohydrolase|nr:carbon-nitrogen hydrolase family protein [Chloroflexia bacterium]
MTRVRIALAQIRCEKGDWPGNLDRAAGYMAQAAAQGCDIIVFPEAGLSGYCDPARFPQAPQPLDSPLVRQFVDQAARAGIAASGGFLEANPGGKPFVTQILAQDGRIAGVYRKVNLGEDEPFYTAGSATPVFTLHTRDGAVPCALAVCADSDWPPLFAAYGAQGARVVFHSSAPGLYTQRTDAASWQAGFAWYQGYLAPTLPGYAREHRLFIAVATQTGRTVDEDFPGGSFVFGPDGTLLAGTTGPEETLLVHEIDVPAAG